LPLSLLLKEGCMLFIGLFGGSTAIPSPTRTTASSARRRLP